MTDFTIHNEETAPEASRVFIQQAKEKYGMIPNLIGKLAESSVATETYLLLTAQFTKTSFSPTERNIVWLTINYENDCQYCMAAHTGIAKMEKVDDGIIEALRVGKALEDPRLETLRAFTRSIVLNRGFVKDEDVEKFLATGFSKENILELLVGVAHKVLSNYTNHIVETPVDAAFEKFSWKKSEEIPS